MLLKAEPRRNGPTAARVGQKGSGGARARRERPVGRAVGSFQAVGNDFETEIADVTNTFGGKVSVS